MAKRADRNSKFFHLSTTIKRHFNSMNTIKNENQERIYDQNKIDEYFLGNFNLFQ